MSDEWNRLTRFVGLFIGTGFLKGDCAQSLLLIGDPGVGKSAMISRFAKVPTVRTVMDLTSDGLRHKLLPQIAESGLRHILFPEFYKLFQRRESTVENTVGLLSLAMSGELHRAYIGNTDITLPEGLQVGMIGAMPTKVFQDWNRQLSNLGVISRMMMVEVRFSNEQRLAIEVAIAMRDKRMVAPVGWRWPERPVEIGYNATRFASRVLQLADDIRSQGDRNRLLETLVALLKAAAILNGHRCVGDVEFQQMREFLPLLRNMR